MKAKTVALIEVIVLFALTLFLIALVGSSAAAAWVRNVTYRAYLEYVVMLGVPLIVLLVSRRNLADYGISFARLRYHLDVALLAFIPFAVAGFVNSLVDDRSASGALVLSLAWIAVLVVLGLLLRRKPTFGGTLATAAMPLAWLAASPAAQATPGKAISALIFYVFFLGFGEELLFRGYIQSRLNVAFGKPFTFLGVHWGWGAVVSAVLFGAMHFLNVASLAAGDWLLMPWWGVWTFFGGLALSLVREKTGSIVAPSILHGLPQGIAWAFLGM